jgi:hypothetical protein
MAASAALVPAAGASSSSSFFAAPSPGLAADSGAHLANAPADDPIFAAIDAHARAYADFGASLTAQSAAEEALGQATEETRAACQARLDALLAAEETLGLAEMEASEQLVTIIPETLAGAAAVLCYVRECFERENYALCEDNGYRALLFSTECAIRRNAQA